MCPRWIFSFLLSSSFTLLLLCNSCLLSADKFSAPNHPPQPVPTPCRPVCPIIGYPFRPNKRAASTSDPRWVVHGTIACQDHLRRSSYNRDADMSAGPWCVLLQPNLCSTYSAILFLFEVHLWSILSTRGLNNSKAPRHQLELLFPSQTLHEYPRSGMPRN